MAEWLIWDTESDGLLQEATRLHSLQLGTVDGADATVYCDALPGYPPISEGLARLTAAERLIGHNTISHDFPLLEKLHPGTVRLGQMIDTLLLARLSNPEEKLNSLREWGERLGVRKGDFEGPWDVCTPAMMEYAAQDVPTTRALWNHVKAVMDWGPVVDTEHKFAWLMHLQTQNGFTLNVAKAQELDAEFRAEIHAETERLRTIFPPMWIRDGKDTFTPKKDDKKRGYVAGVPFTKVKLIEFSPASRHQVAARLQRLGWQPKKFGADGTATVDEAVLAALPYPEAKQLVKLYVIMKMLGQVSDGKAAWLKLVKPSGRVHGRVNTIGCAPGRCSHSGPNMAQVSKKDLRMREVWEARLGWVLVGCDAEGLQARGLASYLHRYDGGAYAKKILEGDKKLKTDEHSSNLRELPFLKEAFNSPPEIFSKARDQAKRCLYAVLFGASDNGLGRYVKEGCAEVKLPRPRLPDRELGALARQALFRAIKGFQQLTEALNTNAKRGYLKGPDGRHIFCRSKHSQLVFLMQGAEAAVMKLALVIFHFVNVPIHEWVHGEDFAYCANVHDEVQIECKPDIAEDVGKLFAECIVQAGVALGLKCPLAGSYAIGPNWSATH